LGLVGAAQAAQHAVRGHIADTAPAHGAVLDGDDGVRESADVVQHDFAVWAKHLGQPADDGQQCPQALVEWLLVQTNLPAVVAGGSQG
jgi:hypothetical protein